MPTGTTGNWIIIRKKIGSTESQLRKHRTYYALLQRQQQITADQYRLAWQQYERDSLLYIQQVLSAYEHETARSTYLQSRYSLESANASLETERIQIGQLEESLLDLRLEQMEKEEVLQQNLRTSVEQVTNAINSWKLSYCLYAPIAGKVSFTTYWNENQYIPSGDTVCTIVPDSGDTVCTIVPESRSRLMGKAHREGELVNSSRFFLKNSLHEEYFPQTLF